MKALARIAYDWGLRCFGSDHMRSIPTRALRQLEESIEFAQSIGLSKDEIHLLTEVVYSRPVGKPLQELGGILVTTSVLCTALDTDIETVFETEIRRCLAKSPEHFAQRNREKLQLGLGSK